MSMPTFSIIVAVSANLGIGKDNRLLCHIPGDLKRFKGLTTGHTVIMGKRTWESLPNRPLPNRRNIVITDIAGEMIAGAVMAYSIDDALKLADQTKENFIIGGASIYRQFLPLADKLYLTRVHKVFEADAYFPEILFNEWEAESREHHAENAAETGFEFTYEVYNRKKRL